MIRLVKYGSIALVVIIVIGVIGAFTILYRYGAALPDVEQLQDYEPPITTRVHASDGRLLAEFARERRLFVPIEAIPQQVIQAFLAAEDKNFYSHFGLDFVGIVRAAVTNVFNLASDKRLVGASTVTQQVAKNFLLTNEVSLERKIKEAILAFRIEQALEKDRILELYLNEIYLGGGNYGVAAAALSYFDKSMSELTLEEVAYLAALPKAPNNYHPTRRYEAAVDRRNWVLGRMKAEDFIEHDAHDEASALPLVVAESGGGDRFSADFFNEEVRRRLVELYGFDALYEGGLSVRSTLDPRLQAIAEKAMRDGLISYDRRHGWRGPLAQIELDNWQENLHALEISVGRPSWRLAAVLDVEKEAISIGFKDGTEGRVDHAQMRWARPWLEGQVVGARPKSPSDVVAAGDVIVVERHIEATEEEDAPSEPAVDDEGRPLYSLQQIPEAEGALVALDPHTGRVLALVGGFDYGNSQFNRATQAQRQPGSAFKPFIYATALDNGFTPSDLILDAPFVIDQGPGLPKWKPANYSRKFYGPSTLRLGVEKSRNLMTVRLAQYVGMDKIARYAERFGIVEDMPETLAMSLGAAETTLLDITTAYAMLVNGGKRVTPSLIDRIQDKRGRTIYRHDERPCEVCKADRWQAQDLPVLPDLREEVIAAGTAYQVVSFLEGVVLRGTGVRVRAVGKPLGGKTGTTNDSFDTWFVGFAPDLAVGVFVGFDTPSTLGSRETGSSVSAPVFRDFMAEALADQPAIPFRIPSGIRLVRVNAKTGLPTRPGDRNAILEAFQPGTEPGAQRAVLDGSQSGVSSDRSAPVGTGGLY